MSNFLEQVHKKLIVSCQALEHEPLHSSYIMSRMAYAAMLGGAAGIRANTVEDITAIKETVNLPVIGIIKHVYGDCPVFITPTEREVDALVSCGTEVIALDATSRPRPDGVSLPELFAAIRRKYPGQLFMADCSTYEDAAAARDMGFDIVGTTLRGYTRETAGMEIPDMDLIARLGQTMGIPVIAEGGIWTPQQLHDILSMDGIHAAVIGGAITRPLDITKRFVQAIES